MERPKRLAMAAIGCATTTALILVPSATAHADPIVDYPSASTATRASGLGFDTCTAPPIDTLRAWRDSTYQTVNVYFGDINRSCRQPELDTGWVRQAASLGWNLLPTYVGHQPSCLIDGNMHTFGTAEARAHGRHDADDAVARAQALGFAPGSALYADVEHYDRSDAACRDAVRDYVTAWTDTLHARGYLAGVYVHHNSGLADLSEHVGTGSRPDAVWLAKWDGSDTLTGWPGTSDARWPAHQRIKQYRGEHQETHGGVAVNIDSNVLDAPVATVARQFRVTSTVPLNARVGPATSYDAVSHHAPGSSLSILCQARGQTIGSNPVWNRLADGTWVSDHYVDTPSSDGFSSVLPTCTYPAQVTTENIPLNARTGPGTGHGRTGAPLPGGALAWVTCQARGTNVFGNDTWNKLDDGRWVSDYYVATGSSGDDGHIPRCN